MVEVALQTPSPECITTQTLTRSYQTLLMPHMAPRATFTILCVVISCR